MILKFHSRQKIQTRRGKCHPGIWNLAVADDLGEPSDCVGAGRSPKGVALPARSASCQPLLRATGLERTFQIVQYPLAWLRTPEPSRNTLMQPLDALGPLDTPTTLSSAPATASSHHPLTALILRSLNLRL